MSFLLNNIVELTVTAVSLRVQPDAPLDLVWAVMLDTAAYGEWNPFVEKADIDLKKIGLDVVVRVGGQKRTIILPSALARQSPAGAGFEDGTLTVTFTDERTAPTRGPDLEPLAGAPRPDERGQRGAAARSGT